MPENDYPKAPLLARLGAMIIDFVFIALLSVVSIGLITLIGREQMALALAAGLPVGLYAIFYAFTKDGRPGGQSIGKAWMGLRVIKLETGAPIGRGTSALRTLVMQALGLFPFGGLVEPIMVIVAKDGRRLGDLAAGTMVIEDKVSLFPRQ